MFCRLCTAGVIRAPLCTAICRDEARTWEHVRTVAALPEGGYGHFGYPGVTFTEGGKIALINYHALDGIHPARIGVDWFYAK